MKHDIPKISNYFVPKFSNQFKMNKFDGFESEFSDEVINNDADMKDIAVPFGIIDAWKLNSGYKQLLEELKIQNFDNRHAIAMILEQIKKYRNNEELKFELNSELFYGIDSIDNIWFPSTESNLEAIFLWRTTHLPVSSIAFKVGI